MVLFTDWKLLAIRKGDRQQAVPEIKEKQADARRGRL